MMPGRDRLVRQLPFPRTSLSPALLLLGLVIGCSESPDYPHVGDMEDFSYSDRRGRPYGPTASGGELALEHFKGQFVWVEYAATWCSPCAQQAQTVQRVEHEFSDAVVFVTVMTSANPSTGGPTATAQTARQWAQRFRLDPDRVTASDLWYMTIPHHILYSPDGQTLYRNTGFHSADRIREVLASGMRRWREWGKR